MRRSNESSLNVHSIINWIQLFRDVTVQYFFNHLIKIGRSGSIVEIDETVITRHKYNRGKITAKQQWFFGGVERGSDRCFIVPVDCRNAETLLLII